MPIADSDAHVFEPNDLWVRYLSDEWKPRAPRVREPTSAGGRALDASRIAALAAVNLRARDAGLDPDVLGQVMSGRRVGFRHVEVDGITIWEGIPDGLWSRGLQSSLRLHPALAMAGYDAAAYVAALRSRGIARAHLYPTAGLWLFSIDAMEPPFAAALVRAYNDWLRDYCQVDPDMLVPVGAVCRHDPAAMVDELRRVASWGWRTVTVRPNPVRGHTLASPEYESFWSACEELGVSVAIHEGTHARLPTAGADRFSTRFARHACSHPLEQMMAMLSLIEGGVLERHPALQVGFLEAGAGWLPYWLWRLDNEYQQLDWEVEGRVRMKPSDYVRRQCFVTCDPREPGLEQVVALLGGGCLLYGSDFPHVDHDSEVGDSVELLSRRLSPALARRICWDNANAFYRMGG